MIKVGLTGGIGSGKSTVAKIFERLSIPVFYADEQAKEILNTNPLVKENLLEYFGAALYADDQLNRAFLAEKIFNNSAAIAHVNSVVHPAVADAFENWCAQQNANYVLKEAAILFETGAYKQLDYNILVSANKDLRFNRVKARNAWADAEIEKRMASQWTDKQKIPLSDFVIYNNQTELLIPQILEVHENINRSANSPS